MFCEKCGKEIPDSTKFCPYCGAPVSKAQDFVNKAGEAFNAAEQELGSAFDEVKQSFTGTVQTSRMQVDSTMEATRTTEPTVQRRLPE
ncbi:MAG: zinc-ribbon domain-containing protein [Agathobacter rectalis]